MIHTCNPNKTKTILQRTLAMFFQFLPGFLSILGQSPRKKKTIIASPGKFPCVGIFSRSFPLFQHFQRVLPTFSAFSPHVSNFFDIFPPHFSHVFLIFPRHFLVLHGDLPPFRFDPRASTSSCSNVRPTMRQEAASPSSGRQML